MKRFTVLFALILFSQVVYSQKLKNGLRNIERRDFEKALRVFQLFEYRYPEKPFHHYGKALIYSNLKFKEKNMEEAFDNAYQLKQKYLKLVAKGDLETIKTFEDCDVTQVKIGDLYNTLEKEFYKSAIHLNKLNYYDKMAKEYPNTFFNGEFISRRNQLAFKKAKKENTVESFSHFIEDYPDSREVPDAKYLKRELVFKQSVKENTIESYNGYIMNFPDSKFLGEAVLLRDKLAFEKAYDLNTINAYKVFIAGYPNSVQAKEAKQRIKLLKGEEIKIENYKAGFGTMIDPRDLQAYKTTIINNKTWMVENIRYRAIGSTVFGDDEKFFGKFGRLYDFETAKTACPDGWHLPTRKEFHGLINYIYHNNISASLEDSIVNARLNTEWEYFDYEENQKLFVKALENANFSLKTAGVFIPEKGGYVEPLGLLILWSDTEENPTQGNAFILNNIDLRNNLSKESRLYCRCLRN